MRRLGITAAIVLIVGGAVKHASRHAATGPAVGWGLNHQHAAEAMPSRKVSPAGRKLGSASKQLPLGEGLALPGTTSRPADCAPFRLATFNIHSGKGLDGRRDLARTASLIEAVEPPLDFIALNEVRGPQWLVDADQTAWLGRRLGMMWLAAPAARTWYHCDSGNGLLSRHDARYWQRIPLPRRHDHSQRNAVLVELPWQGTNVRVLLTHITRSDQRDRKRQLRTVIGLFLALEEPAALVGDLNTTADDPLLSGLLEQPGVIDAVAAAGTAAENAAGTAAKASRDRIDWIIVRGLRVVDAAVVDNEVSDHPLVWAEVCVPARPSGNELDDTRPARLIEAGWTIQQENSDG